MSTRLYFRSDQHTINGLLAYKLTTSNSASNLIDGFVSWDLFTLYSHFKIVKRASNGTETVIGAWGRAEVSASITPSNPNGQNFGPTAWSCPATTIGATDSLVVYAGLGLASGGVSWSVAFSTTQNPGNLAAAAWYFNRWISWVDQGGEAANEGYMWWGHPTAYPGYVDVVFAGAGSPVPDLTLSNGTATTVRVTCNASDADTVDDKLYRMGGKYTTVADIQIYGTLIHTWTGNHGSVYYDDTFKEGWPHYYGVVRTSNVAPTTQAACSPSLYSVPHKHFTGGEMRAEGSHFFTAASLLGCAANYGGDWTFASNGDGTYTYKNLAGAQYADAFSTWAAMDRLHDFRLEVKAKSNSWGGDLGLIFPYASEGYYRRIDFGGFKTSAN